MDFGALALGVAFVVMWSSAFTSARIVVLSAPPFLSLSLRFLVSGLLALAIGWALGQRIALTRTQWWLVAVFGLCQNALYLGLNFQAMQTIEASVAVVIASLLPLCVAALGRMLGLAVGFAGVLVIMSARLGSGTDPAGVALCLIAVVALSVATLLVRGAAGGGNLWMIVGLQMLVGSALLWPLAWFTEEWRVAWSVELVLAFAYTTLVPGVAATMIWFVLVARIGATRAATFHFLNPFIGVAIAAAVLGESVGGRDVLGVIIIMLGILAVQMSRNAARPRPLPLQDP
jgi:drug/metabolite transporter (DMT)-like permease